VLPKTLQANIQTGRLVAWGLDVPLPIAGSGKFEVLYVGEGLRLFRSGGRTVVQVRQDRLEG
jgi:hypothetical protein